MKVLYVIPHPSFGGAERITFEWICAHSEHFVPLALVGGEGELAVALRQAGVPVFVGAQWRQRNFLKWVPLAVRIILEQKIDLVHSCMQSGHLVGGTAAFLTRRPVVCYNHGPIGDQRTQGIAPFIPADCVMVASAYMESIQQKYWFNTRRVMKMAYGLDSQKWRHDPEARTQMRRRYGLSHDDIAIGIFARLVRWKGHSLIFQALGLVQSWCRRPLKLFIVGGEFCGYDPGYEVEIRGLINASGLQGRVVLTGHQSEVSPYYDLVDIVVNASNEEPFGLVVAEAMLKERVAVVPNHAGPAEMVEDGVTGFHYSAGSAESLADALIRAIASRDETTLRERARASIASRYAATDSIRCLEAQYESVLFRNR